MEASEAAHTEAANGDISVLFADDDREFRAALEEVVATSPHLRLVGLAVDAAGAVALAERHRPDVAVLDVWMPGGGVQAAREIRRRSPGTGIIALSAFEDPDTAASMTGAGAGQYLVKGRVTGDELVLAIRRAAGR